jgi:hypothetical protein
MAMGEHGQEVGVDDAMPVRSVQVVIVIVDEMEMERGKQKTGQEQVGDNE